MNRMELCILRKTVARVLALIALLPLAGCGLMGNLKAHVKKCDSNGLARGVALQGIYAYLADGFAGLKIDNISNPKAVNQVGELALAGFTTRVEVADNLAFLNDSQSANLRVVDVLDKFAPTLKWTVNTKSPVSEIKVSQGLLALAEKGTASDFLGVELFSCGLDKPSLLQTIAASDVIDIALDSTSLCLIDAHALSIYARKGKVVGPSPLATLTVSASDTLQSLDNRLENYLLILGDELYLVDVSNPKKPFLADHISVKGNKSPRCVRTSESMMFYFAGHPWIKLVIPLVVRIGLFSYSTLKEFGQGVVAVDAGKILSVQQTFDVDAESSGYAKLYQIALPNPLASAIGNGISGVGALDNYGLAYMWLD